MSAPLPVNRASLFTSSTTVDRKISFLVSCVVKIWRKGYACPSSVWPPFVLALLLVIEYKYPVPSAWRLLIIGPVAVGTLSRGARVGTLLAILTTMAATYVDFHHRGLPVLAFSLLVHSLVLGGVVVGIIHTEDRHRQTMLIANHDGLTGALNRHAVEVFAASAVSQSLVDGAPLVVAMLDCDKFKKLNDIHGHTVGDLVLTEIVRLVRHAIGPGARVGRRGGDEFLIVWPGQSEASAEVALLRASNTLSDMTLVMGHPASFSFGVASVGHDGYDVKQLVEAADQDMYLRKLTKQYGPNFLETMPGR